MKLQTVNRVYFLGIGGIGMSALARYFHKIGAQVFGYDKTPSIITQQLQQIGVEISFEDNPSIFPENIDLVVYTPAIPNNLNLLLFIKKSQIALLKRSVVLAMIANENRSIAVAGTHGKTSTSGMIAHVLASSKIGCTAFVGGILSNYNSNFISSENSNIVVVEADEFDRSFLHLSPNIALLTSVDADHLDIYKNENDLKNAFQQFADKVENGGSLILHKEISKEISRKNGTDYFTYALEEKADYFASNLHIENGLYHFDLNTPNAVIENLKLGALGLYNVLNAVGAAAALLISGISEAELREGFASFLGIKRRFEIRINEKNLVMIDDYAHHPEELKTSINSVRLLFPEHKITAVFQPHLFSRTRDFVDGFAESLDSVDELLILDIYPARELPIAGVSSEIILEKMKLKKRKLVKKSEICDLLCENPPHLLLMLGAGDIDRLVSPIEICLRKKVIFNN